MRCCSLLGLTGIDKHKTRNFERDNNNNNNNNNRHLCFVFFITVIFNYEKGL